MEKVVKQYLTEIGYESAIDENQENRVNIWLEIYKGKTKKHYYKVYNGKKYVDCELATLNMASQTCEDVADFFFNEKLEITIDNKNVETKIRECFEQNNFLHNANNLMQLVNALGTGCIVPYLSNGVLKMNFNDATNIIILNSNKDEVIDVVCWSKKQVKGNIEYYFNRHMLEENGYVIYNNKYILSNEEIIKEELSEELKRIPTNSFIPTFAIIKTPIVNNRDINSPYGLSRYDNAMDVLLAVDKSYDAYVNEIVLGKKRVYVKAGATKFNVDEQGNTYPVFDSSEVVYYQVPGDEKDDMIKESSFDLRIDELTSALQGQLNLLTSKMALGHNYYKFKDGEVYVNTDNIISSNSDVYRKIKKQENILTYALTNLIYAIAQLIGIKEQFSISIFYDDSIIEDTAKKQTQAMLERNNGLISDIEYYMDVYGMKEKEALAYAKQVAKHKQKIAELNPVQEEPFME